MARCPAHDDLSPSLSIRAGSDGKVLVRCHAGCDQDAGDRRPPCARSMERKGGLSVLAPRAPVLRRSLIGDETLRTEAALAIWRATTHAAETPAADIPERARSRPSTAALASASMPA